MMVDRAGRVDRQRANNFSDLKPVPAPIGGLNARDSLAAMAPTDAIILDNWFCQPTYVELRKGRSTLATFTGNAESVMGYRGIQTVTPQLFAGVNNSGVYSIYRVDNAGGGSAGSPVVGGAGATVQALHSTYFDYNQFGSGSGEVLYAVNASGQDLPLLFDGSTWQAINTSGGTFQLTGGPSGGTSAGLKTLSQVAVYKQRLWFLQQGTFQVWYLPQLQFAGALTQLNLGADFKLGGYLTAMITVSVDNSNGLNDFMAFCTTEGEVVVYQGFDPSNSATWYIVSHFVMGRLLAPGRRSWTKVGQDAMLLTIDGGIMISQAMLTDRTQTQKAVTDKIRQGLAQQIATLPTAQGWEVSIFPVGQKMIINNPTSQTPGFSFQWVANTLSGAWSTFGQFNSSWNAFCFEQWIDGLYAGQAGKVSQVDTGLSDAGSSILYTVKVAFSQFDQGGTNTLFSMCQPIFQVNGSLSISITFNIDFEVTGPTGSIPVSVGNSAVWNVALWGSLWGDATLIAKPWIGINREGSWGAIYMQIAASNLTCRWMATNYVLQPGGKFYGPSQ